MGYFGEPFEYIAMHILREKRKDYVFRELYTPESFLELTKHIRRLRRKHTDWISGTIAPVHKGYYERAYVDGVFYHYWNGKKWLTEKDGMVHWRQVGDYPAWAGIVNSTDTPLPCDDYMHEYN